ncbi:dual oxidase 1 [Triplophysa rosa]|uniref:NAD(P)H oxidase (H2O2-forming) n=1 Tax=Triplophysa rosa TaxID=992332 RepID=A0A9W8C9X9_TRIRA|nr:dual oxidase 1 [Triplophysa rosa]KAI7811828.1 Dual oxidase 1 [Triplophysa rosa]
MLHWFARMGLFEVLWRRLTALLVLYRAICADSAITWEVQRSDGWYNNLAYHGRGAANSALVRLLPAQYADGVYQPRQEPNLPNPRRISNTAMSGQSGLLSHKNRTVLSVAFGYHVWSEISESRRPGCPPEFMHIEVQKDDPVFGSNSSKPVLLPFQRAAWDDSTGKSPNNPRAQLNHVTAWTDGSSIYGSSSSWCDALRMFSRGLLASGSSPDMPRRSNSSYLMWSAPDPTTGPSSQELFEFGNAWANENIFSVIEGIIWFRYHNHLASKLHEEHPSWSDEELFQAARKTVIATFQNIAFYEWLPAYLGIQVPSYLGYQKYVDPSISAEFEAAAVRFGLTLAPPGVYKRNRTCHYQNAVNVDGSKSTGLRLCNAFWSRNNPNVQSGQDVDELVMGMASQIAEREDNIVVEDLKDYMYGPLRFSRSDAVALTIQRGRDFGLPSYNQVRESFNIRPVDTWEEINPKLNNTQLLKELAELYENDTSRLELFVGGLLEAKDGPGPVFSAIILDQFERIRNADRFWFENRQNGLFSEEEIQAIRNTTFHDVLLDVTRAKEGDIQKNVFFWVNDDPCPQPEPMKASDLYPCTQATSMSFFDSSSKAGFGITVVVLFLFPVVSFIVACVVAHLRSARYKRFQKKLRGSTRDEEPTRGIAAKEWLGHNTTPQQVTLAFNEKKVFQVFYESRSLTSHNLFNQDHLDVLISNDHLHRALLLKIPKEYDLVLFFDDVNKRSEFLSHLRSELDGRIQSLNVTEMSEREILNDAVTREQREKIVETFFKHAFAKVLDIDKSDVGDLSKRTREALQCELTHAEFARVFGLKPDSLFVESMFTLADKDGNGYISFQEFLDVIVIFMTGTPEEKSKLLFSMHDIKGDGFLSKEEFSSLLRSFIEISGGALSKSQFDDGIAVMLQASGLDNKDHFSWEDFHFLLRDHSAQLNIKGMEVLGKKKLAKQQRISFIAKNSSPAVEDLHSSEGHQVHELRQRQTKKFVLNNPKVYVKPQRERYNRNPVKHGIQQFKRFVENYRRHIVCIVIMYGIIAGLALERCYHYGLQADGSGIPETSLVGVLVSRGSAAAISFLFPYMLLTVCRNLITLCRETFLNRYIPFDAAIDLHRHMAMVAIILSVVHSLGHVVNVYVFCISDLSILACLFPRVFSDNGSELPMKWTFWFFKTVPGLTGILLLLIFAFIYVFASRYFRRISFRGFWVTHYLYVLVYVMVVIHGSYALLQQPLFHIYLIPPGLLFLLDKLISLNRKKVEIPVVKAELLPSGVTYLEFKRPQGFVYRSGQWVRIASLELGTDEYHPFTLTSAPHEETLSLHIRAVGPWTSKLREVYTPEKLQEIKGYPKLYLDGPFGEGHQEWTDYEVSVLVGAGIGVTPFASILKDLVFKSSVKCKFHCKKVYFIWVTRTQRQFEWVSDIIREVEEMDTHELVSVHIYITQLAEKFDLRTTMLYVCERHFQKVWNRSLFTGLRSITHFGRPPFVAFLSSLQEVHPEVEKVGVFSCGPPGLTKNVEQACRQMNKQDQTHFVHHYENF